MLSKYFYKKVGTTAFDEHLKRVLDSLQGKKVLIYGAGAALEYLKDKYPLLKLNIVAIADMKFKEIGTYNGLKVISPDDIKNFEFDFVLVSNEYTRPIVNYLTSEQGIDDEKIMTLFNEIAAEEKNLFNVVDKLNFGRHLLRLEKKLKGKKVVIYGAGAFFQVINEFYDLKKLNIVAISDMRFSEHGENETFLGYSVCSPNEIKDIKPDYVLVGTLKFIDIIEDLLLKFKGEKIKVKPLINKPFWELLKEIWNE